jgi:hypothetical protein
VFTLDVKTLAFVFRLFPQPAAASGGGHAALHNIYSPRALLRITCPRMAAARSRIARGPGRLLSRVVTGFSPGSRSQARFRPGAWLQSWSDREDDRSPMLELLFILAVLVGAVWLAVRAFARPERVYVRALIAAALAIVGGLALLVVLSPFLGSGAGMGVVLIYLAYVALVVAIAALACLAATARHAWDALRSRR